MCLIIDANVIGDFTGTKASDDAALIVKWLTSGHGRIVYGGTKLLQEYAGSAKFLKTLDEWRRHNWVRQYDNKPVDDCEDQLTGKFESNDRHVVALAEVSGARVLYTNDLALMKDFSNRKLLSPKGKIYQRAKEHAHLLGPKKFGHTKGCPGAPSVLP